MLKILYGFNDNIKKKSLFFFLFYRDKERKTLGRSKTPCELWGIRTTLTVFSPPMCLHCSERKHCQEVTFPQSVLIEPIYLRTIPQLTLFCGESLSCRSNEAAHNVGVLGYERTESVRREFRNLQIKAVQKLL